MLETTESGNSRNQPLEVSDFKTSEFDNTFPQYRGRLKRLSAEFALELGFMLLGLVLAVNWNVKLGIALSIFCLRFGVADFVTAWIVAGCDPDRWHGAGVGALFIAYGFLRAAVAASLVLACSCLAMLVWDIRPGNGNQGLILVSLGTGFLCAYGYLLMTLPLSIFAFCVSWFSARTLSFAAGLTQLRQSGGQPFKTIQLNIEKSLRNIAIASGSAATVLWVLVVGVIVRPNMGPFLDFLLLSLAFLIPFFWGFVFISVVAPRSLAGVQREVSKN